MQRDDEWYWSLTQHKVVRGGETKNDDVLGPYSSYDEAAGALDKVRSRNDSWLEDEEKGMSEEEKAEHRDREKFGTGYGF